MSSVPPDPPVPPRRMSFRAKLLLWTALSFAVGVAGGYVGHLFGAPFYFGFFFAWVLTGMTGMFVLAAHVAAGQQQR